MSINPISSSTMSHSMVHTAASAANAKATHAAAAAASVTAKENAEKEACFSPTLQSKVRDVQIRIREIDAALHPSIRTVLGSSRTFAYSTLAASCGFLDSVQLGSYSTEIQAFAKLVSSTVEECFEEIRKSNLNDEALKLKLVDKLRKMQQYPNPVEITSDPAPTLIEKLQKIITPGTFDFYKLNASDSKYYGGVLHIEKNSFSAIVKIMEEAGYKEEGDKSGSSFDVGAHVTTILSSDLSKNYDQIMRAHSEFTSKSNSASLKPLAIRTVYPKSGQSVKAVVIAVASNEIEAYRKACGLGELVPPAHISVFTKEVKPLKMLESPKVTLVQFINKETPYLKQFNNIFKAALERLEKQQKQDQTKL